MPRPTRRTVMVWAALAAPLLAGGTSLALHPGAPHAFGCSGELHAPLDHLARCDHGATVTVSSLLLENGHHPVFLLDGRDGTVASRAESWVSRPSDVAPWVEIALPAPRVARRVILHHAGERDGAGAGIRDFTVSVLAPEGWREVAAVRGNRAARTEHALPPLPIAKVRIAVERGGADGRAALYEVELRDD